MLEIYLTIKTFIFHKDFRFMLLSSEKDSLNFANAPRLANKKSLSFGTCSYWQSD